VLIVLIAIKEALMDFAGVVVGSFDPKREVQTVVLRNGFVTQSTLMTGVHTVQVPRGNLTIVCQTGRGEIVFSDGSHEPIPIVGETERKSVVHLSGPCTLVIHGTVGVIYLLEDE
jgi:hypothetical protein